MPQYLFTKARTTLPRIEARLRETRRLFLFLDYDGTIVQIRKHPHQAVLSPRMRKLLVLLKGQPGVTLGFVTGRSLADIKKLIHMNGIVLAANHGFEIAAEGRVWTHPRARKLQPRIARLSGILRQQLQSFPGVLVENKRSTLSIHYRNVAPSSVDHVRSVVETAVSRFRRNLALTTGKKVIEIRPNVAWSKGHAIRRLLRRSRSLHNTLVVYCGDDVTDEDAFRMLSKEAVTIRVGKDRTSRARFLVGNVTELHRFLSLVCAWRTGSGKTTNPGNRSRN